MDENLTKLEARVASLEGQLAQLQRENQEYKKDNDTLLQAIRNLYGVNSETMNQISKILTNQTTLDITQGIIRVRCDNLRYELLDPMFKREEYHFPVIINTQETIDEIIKSRKSMARFGDGEFAQIIKVSRHKFQKLDDRLGQRLEEVLHSHNPNVLIAIANNYGSLQDYTESAADAIRIYMSAGDTREQHMKLLEHDRVYYDAYMSRPYVMYRDWKTDLPRKRFAHLKEIWKDRDVIIVEGAQTRMGVGNDLLEGAKDIKRILAPATSSFDRYDDILKAALQYAQKDSLFLVAMGPSAGVLAYDLALEGYQAIDIGHIDLEYEWFLAGKGERVAVPCKYNNELEGDDNAMELHDPVYEGQILASFQ